MKTAIAIAACLVCVSASAAEAPKVTVEKILNTDTTVTGQTIVMPKDPTLTVSVATFPPGAALAVHKHPYPHYGYVLDGELTLFNEETGKRFTIRKGQFLVEMNDTWHYGKNLGTTPVRLLVIDHLPKGATSNMIVRDKK